MLPKSILPLIAELVAKLSKIPKLATAVLYGSAARGELTETSDIDLLLIFDVPHNPETGGELDLAHRALGEIKTHRRFQLVAANLEKALDPDFLDNICRDGIVIYGKPLVLTAEKLQLKPSFIFTYSMTELTQIERTRLQRALKGYWIVKKVGKKRYVSEKDGMLKALKAKKLGKGVVMVPQEGSKALEDTLKQHGAKYRKIKIWS